MFLDRQPIAALPGTAAAATEAPGYLRGIEANRQAIADAKDKVDNDNNMSLADKELTKQALDQMNGNLGEAGRCRERHYEPRCRRSQEQS